MFRRCFALIFAVVFTCLCAIAQDKTPKPIVDPDQADRDHNEQLQREQWFRDGRTSPNADVSAADLLGRAHQQRMQQRSVRRSQTSGATGAAALSVNPVWTLLGPSPMVSSDDPSNFQDYGNVSGRVTSVAVDQSDPTGNTVYIGAAYGGLWKSTNAAAASPTAVTWTPLTDSQATLAVGAVSVSPDGNTVLVGTGEPNNAGDSYYGLGILRGINMKTAPSFSLIPATADAAAVNFKGVGFAHFAWNTTTPTNVVASVANTAKTLGSLPAAPSPNQNVGLFFSNDSGATWHQGTITDGGSPVNISSVTGLSYNAAAGKYFAAVRTHGIFVSSDNGQTWTRLAAQPGNINTANCPATNGNVATCPMYRAEIAVTPGRNEMFVWFVDVNETNQSVWVTRDGGATWSDLGTAGGMTGCGDTVGGCSTEQGTYNLELAAVPNGTGTDLYAGAINIFKCSLGANGTSCGTSWLNTTHVYGCFPQSAAPHVHPDQHAIDFITVAGKNVIYFGNDGGVNRTLDGNGIYTTQCTPTTPNPVTGQLRNNFDDLNTNLALTQFVWFSHDATQDQVLLGGTQDNGSPSLNPVVATPTNAQLWTSYLEGDGGFTAIDGANWFTEQPGNGNSASDILRTTAGTNGRGAMTRVVGAGTLNGDDGAFYTPFMLDPAAPSRIIVGTCRVWRGNTNGSLFTAISPNFSTGSVAACSIAGGATTIRALAAGGVSTANGSQVIYAGTSSAGTGHGKVFVTENADGGTATWSDRTGSINPSGYQISSIVVDQNDKSGRTAFVTIMGFGGGHVFRTTDAGANWTNVTGNLPDAPADSFAMDPADPTVWYVATDTGVFVSTNGGAVWTEFGPAAGAGFLPNVAPTHLETINIASTKKLRVSTYGRGVWQADLASVSGTTPDFAVSATGTTTQTIAKGGTATYTVAVNAAGTPGFAGTVTLGCGVLPAATTCTFTPASVAPGGTATVTIKTTASSGVQRASVSPSKLWSLGIVLPGIVMVGALRRKRGAAVMLVLLLAVAVMMPGCGGGGGSSSTVVTPPPPPPPPPTGTPAGTYTVVVTASTASVVHSTTVTLTVQ